MSGASQAIAGEYGDRVIYTCKVRLNCYCNWHDSFVMDIQGIRCTVLGRRRSMLGGDLESGYSSYHSSRCWDERRSPLWRSSTGNACRFNAAVRGHPRVRRKADCICHLILQTGKMGHIIYLSYRTKYPTLVAKAISFFRRLGDFARLMVIFPENATGFWARYVGRRLKAGIVLAFWRHRVHNQRGMDNTSRTICLYRRSNLVF